MADPRRSQDAAALVAEKKRAARSSVLAGFILTVLKLVAGLATGSLGLLAEAAHSMLDLGAALMTYAAVRVSGRPPDDDHTYGHGKIENLTALAETFLLVVTSVWILYEAARRLMGHGVEVEPSLWAFGVMGLSIVLDTVRSRDLKRVALVSRSQALEADALHFSTDIASSAVVIGGLLGVWLARRYEVPWLALSDPIAASVVALIVLVLSYRLGRHATDMLVDRAPKGLVSRVERALGGIEGLERPPKIRVRQGGDRTFAEIELALRPGLPLAEGERIASRARSLVAESVDGSSSVVVELRAEPAEASALRERVATAVAMEGVQAHDITLRRREEGFHADLHLELPGRLPLAEAHAISDRVEGRILEEVGEIRRVDVHLELHDEEPEATDDLEPTERADLEARIEDVGRRVAGAGKLHDILLSRTPGGLYLSCHCFVSGEWTLAQAHDLTDRLEAAVKEALPALARVAVHAEPEGGA